MDWIALGTLNTAVWPASLAVDHSSFAGWLVLALLAATFGILWDASLPSSRRMRPAGAGGTVAAH